MRDILAWLGNLTQSPVGAQPPDYQTTLAQNYPNPFNPTTTIAYSVRIKTPVRLNIYNVAGQLVRTLVDEEKQPGVTYRVVWDGSSNAGQPVSSGVYFYRLTTKGFEQTRKMVLLH